MVSQIFLDIIGYIIVTFYRISTLTNVKRLAKKVMHKLKRQLKLIVYWLFGCVITLSNIRDIKRRKGSRVSKVQLSLFLHDVLNKTTIWWKTRARYLVPYMTFEEHMISKVYGKDIVDVRYVGSYRETISSLHYADTSSDIDIMYIYKNFDVAGRTSLSQYSEDFNVRIIDASAPGYVYLKLVKPIGEVVHNFKYIAMKGKFHMSLEVEKLVEYFEKEVIFHVNEEMQIFREDVKSIFTWHFLRSDAFISMHEKFNRERFAGWLMFQQCGPASKMFWNVSGLPQRIKICPLDMVFALHCPHWPTQASEWQTRKRKYGFPGKKLIKEITYYGVDIVAKSSDPDSRNAEFPFEWRLSFSIAEIALVDRWNETQKSCYRIMKTVHTDYLSNLGITSYSIKNIMFYLIEKHNPRIWKSRNLVSCIFMVLKSLRKSLNVKFCPHYFVKNYNLFRETNEKDLKTAIDICDNFLSDIYGQIWISDGLWFEISARGMVKYFNDLNDTTLTSGNSHLEHVKSRAQWTNDLGLQFKIYYSVKIHREIARIFLNAHKSKHYNEIDVLTALSEFINELGVSEDSYSQEEALLYCHVAWAYTKCLQWMKRETMGFKQSKNCYRCIENYSKLRDNAFEIMQSLSSTHAMQISLASDILLGKDIINIDSMCIANQSIKESTPIAVCKLDRVSDNETIAEFCYENQALYCPLNQLLIFALLEQRRAKKQKNKIEIPHYTSFDELEMLMGKVYTTQFRTIMQPFVKYLHEKIVSLQ